MKSLYVVPLIMLSLGAQAGFDEGMAAYQKGNYADAYQEFLVAGNRGDGDAMVNLEFMSESAATCGPPPNGFVPFLGSPSASAALFQKAARDPRGANLRFITAFAAGWSGAMTGEQGKVYGPVLPLAEASAKQGFPLAMSFTAALYANSKTPDRVTAYAWYVLAERRGFDIKDSKEKLTLTNEERARAENAADKMDKEIPQSRVIGPIGQPICPPKAAPATTPASPGPLSSAEPSRTAGTSSSVSASAGALMSLSISQRRTAAMYWRSITSGRSSCQFRR